jgi:mRNA interferase ChpB
VVSRPRFDRGDIIRVQLNPSAGQEMQGDMRPALVLSPAPFNGTGLAIVAPITQGGLVGRNAGFAVSLSATGTETQGVVLVNHLRSMDLNARGARKVERAPASVVDEALAKVATFLGESVE